MMSPLECALEYASLGFKVAPRHLRDWERKATTNERQIECWWSEHPHSDVRLATGGGLVVVTINGEEGERHIEVFQASVGRLPRTVTARGRHGDGTRHLYFTTHEVIPTSRGTLGDGIGVEAEGGSVVGVGSQGVRWSIAPLGRRALAPLPGWFKSVLMAARAEQEARRWKAADNAA